jgi:hypothetical protein
MKIYLKILSVNTKRKMKMEEDCIKTETPITNNLYWKHIDGAQTDSEKY